MKDLLRQVRLADGSGQTEQHLGHGHQLRKCFLPNTEEVEFVLLYITSSELYTEGLTNFLAAGDWTEEVRLICSLLSPDPGLFRMTKTGALPGIRTLGGADPKSLSPWKPSRDTILDTITLARHKLDHATLVTS